MSQPRTPRSRDTLERTRYFPRQTVLPADLTQDREYLIDKARRHNRILHGWGIWSGLRVETIQPRPDKKTDPEMPAYKAFEKKVGGVPMTVDTKAGTWVAIAPGFALTPLGDEVYLPRWTFVNTASEVDGALVTAPAHCRTLTARKPSRSGAKMILVLDALEDEVRPVRAAAHRCGDHPDQFEFSRLEDTLRFQLLKDEDGDPFADPYGVKDKEDAAEKDRRRAERLVTGTIQRHDVRLAGITFDATGKLAAEPDHKAPRRDWFKTNTPDPAS